MNPENPIIKEDIDRILSEDIPWEKLRGRTILLTGASGMLGSYIMTALVELNRRSGYGMELYGLMRHPDKLDPGIRNEIHVLQQSVTDPIITDVAFDYILHTASPASPLIMRKDPVGTMAANTLGAWNTLKLARESQARGYLFVSSREIYGQPLPGQKEFTEDTYGFVDPLSPRSCYPEGKKAAETMCACYRAQYGLVTKIARLAHTFGPGMTINDGRVQADFLRDIVNNRDVVMKSQGLPVRTYTYAADAVAAIFRILLGSPDEEMVYNISSKDATVRIRDLAQAMVDAFPERHLKVVMDIPETTGNDGTAPFTLGILAADKLKALGWKPANSLQEGIVRTVAYLESEGIR